MKIAVIFPGIGYHTDKPLLYYGKKLARAHGYEIREVPYKNFKPDIKGDRQKMQEAFEHALGQAEDMLKNVRWAEAEELLFISKSIGTVVAAAYAKRHALKARQIYFTPLAETFLFAAEGEGIAFHGTADPWAFDADIEKGCADKRIPLITVPGANHSLETGDLMRDLSNLSSVMGTAADWLIGG
ncbi:MAG: alpha/beta hydrolase [Lachnospiraceae bacterium]|nr:alpha/beta hydrolase [Lachnospiraceae bacterium]